MTFTYGCLRYFVRYIHDKTVPCVRKTIQVNAHRLKIYNSPVGLIRAEFRNFFDAFKFSSLEHS